MQGLLKYGWKKAILRKIQFKKFDSVVLKPSKTLMRNTVIVIGLIFRSSRPAELCPHRKKACKYNIYFFRGFAPKFTHQPGVSFSPYNFLTEKGMEK